MNHRVDLILFKELGQGFFIGAVPNHQGRFFARQFFHPAQRLRAGIAQIIQSYYVITSVQKAQRRMGADVSGTAR